MKILIIFIFAAFLQSGLLDFSHEWNNLIVTWAANPFNSNGFAELPRTVSEADDQAKAYAQKGKANGGFKLKDDQCKVENASFVGQRYWSNNDPSVILLYDGRGFIAGMQMAIPKKDFTPPELLQNRNYADDGDYWTLTAYFVNPKKICTGRTEKEFDEQGTGNGLWLQIGPDPLMHVIKIPRKEEALKDTKYDDRVWGYGQCFRTMGQHYWYNIGENMNCSRFIPYCLLYNSEKLTGFCFATNAKLSGPRYDFPHPTAQVLSKFMDPVPKCFTDDPDFRQFTTIHVYFVQHPRLVTWC